VIDPLTITVAVACLFMGAFICWLLYLHVLMYRRIRELERDNYRLIRRLGQYYSLDIGVRPSDEPVPESAYSVPSHHHPFFKFKPSPGPRPGGKADL